MWLANVAYERALAGEPYLETAQLARRAYADGALLAAETSDAPTLYLATNALTLCEQFADAERAFADVIAEARGRGSALGFVIASCFRADAANRSGDPRAGRSHAEASVAAAESHGWALGLPMAIGVAVDALLELGEPDAAQATLDHAPLTAGPELPDNVFFIPVLFSRGRLRIAQGDVRGGLADVLEAGRRQDAWGAPNPSVLPWRSTAAEALLALGDREQATALAATELALAERFGAPRTLLVARRAVALTAGATATIDLLRAAIAARGPDRCAGRARALPGRSRRRPAPRRPPPRCARPAARGARRGRCRRRAGARAPRGGRAAGHRRAAAAGAPQRRRRAHALRAARRGARRRRAQQPRDRPAAVRHPAHRRDAPDQRLPQARRALARGAGGRAGGLTVFNPVL